EELVAGFLQAVGDGAVLEPPFADEGFAARLDLLARLGVDHVVVVGTDFLMQPLGRMRQQIAMLVNCAALHRDVAPHRAASALSSPVPPSMISNSGRRRPRLTRSSSTVRQAAALSLPMSLTASSTFCPSACTPITTKSEIEVALRSSLTFTAVPS